MRASQVLLGLATGSAIIAAIASGCGGGSSNSNPPAEAGADATNDVAHEAAPVEAAAEAGSDAPNEACTPDASITSFPIPDASLADGATLQGCASCVQAACPTVIAKCSANCACEADYEAFLTCLGSGSGLLTCGGQLATSPGATSAGITTQDLFCAAGCASACGVTLPAGDGGHEGGGGEAGGDAAGDGPAE